MHRMLPPLVGGFNARWALGSTSSPSCEERKTRDVHTCKPGLQWRHVQQPGS